jgi:hypothetical protein
LTSTLDDDDDFSAFENVQDLILRLQKERMNAAVERLFEKPTKETRAVHSARVATDLAEYVQLATPLLDVEMGRRISEHSSTSKAGNISAWETGGRELRELFFKLSTNQQQLGVLAYVAVLAGDGDSKPLNALMSAIRRARIGEEDPLLQPIKKRRKISAMHQSQRKLGALACREFLTGIGKLNGRVRGVTFLSELFCVSPKSVEAWPTQLRESLGAQFVNDVIRTAVLAGQRYLELKASDDLADNEKSELQHLRDCYGELALSHHVFGYRKVDKPEENPQVTHRFVKTILLTFLSKPAH